ncbi:UNVERIFIED_CONTAM: hypothetical protein Sindi_2702800 [Sesamum indicum]
MSKPNIPGQMVKWAVRLGEFYIVFQTMNAIKAQVLAEFILKLVEVPQEEEERWLFHVDGSSNSKNRGAGMFLQGPNRIEIEVAVRLSFPVANNKAEYEALIQRL